MKSGVGSVKNVRPSKMASLLVITWVGVALCAVFPAQCEARIDTAASPSSQSWKTPGCHLVGHTRIVKIPGCRTFQVTTNACRGFCLSFAYPTPDYMLLYHPEYIFTSRASCCNIIDTVDIPVQVHCGGLLREVVFKSARSCGCSICRRG
ncbi:thyrostimulin alpha-2 subunit-like [Babylonia areolata]|uniref:thyrostimulin alpha-2 subunit-like n=1 Tax=Babylonia areolata TaxID=304850 RepID=UPI003FD655DF